MKTIPVNFRHPNVDRFVEIMSTAYKLKLPMSFHLLNKPKGYDNFLFSFSFASYETDITRAEFVCSFPEETNFNTLFTNFSNHEPIEDIQKRISSVKPVNNTVLDHVSKELLKVAAQRLTFSPDQVNSVLKLAAVIAAMEEKTIEAHHMSEAIHYSPIFSK